MLARRPRAELDASLLAPDEVGRYIEGSSDLVTH